MFYVYALLDPSKNDSVFYIGKGNKDRVRRHYTPTSLARHCHKSHVILAYRAAGYDDKYVILKDNLSNDEANTLEKELIRSYGKRIDGFGSLVNLTDGGEGALLGPLHYCHKLLAAGEHNFQLANPAKTERHPSTIASQEDKHWAKGSSNPCFGIKPWNHPRASEKSKNTWKFAHIYYKYFTHINEAEIQKEIESIQTMILSKTAIRNMMRYINSGWNPSNDIDWCNFVNKV